MPKAAIQGRRRPLPKKQVQVGMTVTCIEPEEAYYSRYAGNPEMWFRPGMVGLVGAVDVPCVSTAYQRRGGTPTFVCVDFKDEAGREWRCALDYNNIRLSPPPRSAEGE